MQPRAEGEVAMETDALSPPKSGAITEKEKVMPKKATSMMVDYRGIVKEYGWHFMVACIVNFGVVSPAFVFANIGFVNSMLDFKIDASLSMVMYALGNTPILMGGLFWWFFDSWYVYGRNRHFHTFAWIPTILVPTSFAIYFGNIQTAQVYSGLVLPQMLAFQICQDGINAIMATKIKQCPRLAPDIGSFQSQLFFVSRLAFSPMAARLSPIVKPKGLNLVCAGFHCLLVPFTFLNWFGERPKKAHVAKCSTYDVPEMWTRKKYFPLLFLTMIMAAIGVSLGESQTPQWAYLILIALGMPILIAAGYHCYPRGLAHVVAYQILSNFFTCINFGSGFQRFMYDTSAEYPLGPHFKREMVQTWEPILGSILGIVSLLIYKKCFSSWSYRPMFIFTIVLKTFLYLFMLPFYTRVNLKWGIPDDVFFFGNVGVEDLTNALTSVPMSILTYFLVLPGQEALMLASASGAGFFGSQCGLFMASVISTYLEFEPAGLANESAQFKNVVPAYLIQSLCPLLAIPLVYFFIPQFPQNVGIRLCPETGNVVLAATAADTAEEKAKGEEADEEAIQLTDVGVESKYIL